MVGKDNTSGSTDRFGFEWDKYHTIERDYEEQFLKWVFPLKKEDFKGKKIMDGGCGIGRNSYWPLTYGAKKVYAFDFDPRTVKAAQENLRKYEHCEVAYGSLYSIPKENEFDISFSIGVIHHLAEPRNAVRQLVKATKKGGSVLIWVYGYEGNEWIVRYINPLRKITSKLPLPLAHGVTYLFSIPLFSFVKLFPQRKPYLKMISKYSFKHVHLIVLDQLIPKIANYWTKKEAKNLFENQGLEDIRVYPVNALSWTVIGKKK